jgi:hypothetical protein
VAIYRFLRAAAFEPEDTKSLGDAYELALVQLGLTDRDDPLTETLAKIIIKVGHTGEKKPNRICALALSQLRGSKRAAS